jgi:hypothetical protein
MIYKSCRGAAGGMDLAKAYTEGVDNSFDAGALVHISGLVTVKLSEDTQIFFEVNDAAGLAAMPHLYGIAKEAPVKMDKADAGIFNSGHTAETGFFDPKEVYSESAIDSKVFALEFDVADFVNEYEKYPDDMVKTQVSDFMRTPRKGRSSDYQDLLEKILERISDKEVKDFFGKLVAKQLPNYMLHVYVLRNERKLDPDQFRQVMPALRMTYSEILTGGTHIIHVLDDSETPENNVIRYTAEDAIDPLWDTEKFPVLMANAEFRRNEPKPLAERTPEQQAAHAAKKAAKAAAKASASSSDAEGPKKPKKAKKAAAVEGGGAEAPPKEKRPPSAWNLLVTKTVSDMRQSGWESWTDAKGVLWPASKVATVKGAEQYVYDGGDHDGKPPSPALGGMLRASYLKGRADFGTWQVEGLQGAWAELEKE